MQDESHELAVQQRWQAMHDDLLHAAPKLLAAVGQRQRGEAPEDNTSDESSAYETPLSDQYNAERLVEKHGADMRYCEAWSRWLVWDGKRWTIDETGQVMRWAKDTIKGMGVELQEIEGEAELKAFLAHIKRSLSTRSLEAMVKSAQSEPGIPVTPAAFDRDPWLLNVENGTLNLRTADLRPHRREDLLDENPSRGL